MFDITEINKLKDNDIDYIFIQPNYGGVRVIYIIKSNIFYIIKENKECDVYKYNNILEDLKKNHMEIKISKFDGMTTLSRNIDYEYGIIEGDLYIDPISSQLSEEQTINEISKKDNSRRIIFSMSDFINISKMNIPFQKRKEILLTYTNILHMRKVKNIRRSRTNIMYIKNNNQIDILSKIKRRLRSDLLHGHRGITIKSPLYCTWRCNRHTYI